MIQSILTSLRKFLKNFFNFHFLGMGELRIFDDIMSHWHFDKDHETQSTPYNVRGEPPDGREPTGACDEAEKNGNKVDDLDIGAPKQAAA